MGRDECCMICRTSPALVDFTEGQIECKIPRRGRSWMPIDAKEAADFHQSILVIGAVKDDSLAYFNSKYASADTPVRCLMGLKPSRGETKWADKVDGIDVWRIDGEDENTQDLSCKSDSWTRWDGEEAPLAADWDDFFVHTQCWELLYAICNLQCRRPITPGIFWKGAFETNQRKRKREKEELDETIKRIDRRKNGIVISSDCRSSLPVETASILTHTWPMKYLAYDDCDQWVDPLLSLDERYRSKLSAAIKATKKRCMKRKTKINLKLREDFWTRIDASLWHPIDRFPLLEAFAMSERSTSFDQVTSSSSSSIEALPLEIIEIILGFLDVSSMIKLAMTSREMQRAILPLRDEIVGRSIISHHSWMLPMTPSEKRRWDISVKEATASVPNAKLPWTAYYRLCVENQTSMKNRKRIWINTQLVCSDLVNQGLLAIKA